MAKSRVVFEDEAPEWVRIAYPCFELRDIVAYYFEIQTPPDTITPFAITALPHINIVVSVYLSTQSQVFKVHREQGILDISGDKIGGSLTEAITIIQAPGTHEFSIKFKPGVLHSLLNEDIATLTDRHLPLQKYLEQAVIDDLKRKETFEERVDFAENWLLHQFKSFKPGFKQETVTKVLYYSHRHCDYKLSSVSKQVNVSNATLNRYFKEVLGLSPKQCFKALRFKIGLKTYRSSGSNDLFEALGYTDFSHFVKEAKGLTGQPPSAL